MPWIVWDNEDGLVCLVDSYEEALEEYEKCKEQQEQWLYQNGEFSSDETVVLAEVKKHFYSQDTGKPVMTEDDDGNETPAVDTYWEFKEDSY